MYLQKYNGLDKSNNWGLTTPFVFRTRWPRLDQFFDDMVTEFNSRFLPREDTQNYYLEMELPGFEQKDLDITIEKDILNVIAKNDKRGSFSQSVTLWEGIDYEKLDAKLAHGLLTITLPKLEKIKKRKIVIT